MVLANGRHTAPTYYRIATLHDYYYSGMRRRESTARLVRRSQSSHPLSWWAVGYMWLLQDLFFQEQVATAVRKSSYCTPVRSLNSTSCTNICRQILHQPADSPRRHRNNARAACVFSFIVLVFPLASARIYGLYNKREYPDTSYPFLRILLIEDCCWTIISPQRIIIHVFIYTIYICLHSCMYM